MGIFAAEAKRIYESKLQRIILYGSCSKGDFSGDSDIDVLVLLDVPPEDISIQRKRIRDMTDLLDWDYDVVMAPVFHNCDVYGKYAPVSVFYQNMQKDGVRIVNNCAYYAIFHALNQIARDKLPAST